ncbi:MAG: hypothetical protein K8T10_19815 [Candidatus Eremiobacteraeota bacterium]|nr:hypothetical protein [Candidatus Eremiobacteraeota bacterium]
MKYFKTMFIILVMLCITACYCWGFSAKPKGKLSPGASKKYSTPDRVRMKHTKAPFKGHSNADAVESKPLNPLQIKHTPTPSSEEKSISGKTVENKKSNTIYIVAGLVAILLALGVGGFFYYQRQSTEF